MHGQRDSNYFDDHHISEPGFCSSSGQDALTCLAAMCGFLFDEDKHVSLRPKFVYLGVLHDFCRLQEGTMMVRILPERRAYL